MKREKKKKLVALIILIFFGLNLLALIVPTLLTKAASVTYVQLEINDKLLVSDVSPYIVDNRTIIPVRMVFEAIDAEVLWNESEKKVSIKNNQNKIDFVIGSKTAYLNNTPFELDVEATISKDRTYVPLRFLAENCGFTVFWMNETKTVKLYNNETKNNVLKDISFQKDLLTLTFKDENITYNKFVLENPFRLVIDMNDCVNNISNFETVPNSYFNQLRYSQFSYEPMQSRIVIELKNDVEYNITKTNHTIMIQFSIKEKEDLKEEEKEEVKIGKRVVIDAGHGGKDPGACGTENGIIVLKEKDVNLQIALKAYDLLKAKGVDVHLTRDSDKFLELSEIAQIANDLKADFFVSVHNNASESSSVNGTMTLYAYDEPKEGATVSGKEFATIMQKYLVKATEGKNLGVVKNSALAVIRKTTMPAVITESLFVTNQDDRTKLLDTVVINRIAQAICDGVLEVLK